MHKGQAEASRSLGLLTRDMYRDVILPQATAAAGDVPTVMPSPTPIRPEATNVPLIIDSSGCLNPQTTLTDPGPNQQIAGSFEVRGTANIHTRIADPPTGGHGRKSAGQPAPPREASCTNSDWKPESLRSRWASCSGVALLRSCATSCALS